MASVIYFSDCFDLLIDKNDYKHGMLFIKMEKKGDVNISFWILTFILAILGFLLVLYVTGNLGDIFDDYSEDEICALSILTRATSPEESQRLFPLKCQTKKVCLTQKGEDCTQFLGVDKSEINKINLPSGSVGEKTNAARKIEEIQVQELYRCWDLTGQGKLDLFGGVASLNPKEGAWNFLNIDELEPRCIICSRIAIADDLSQTEEGKKILTQVDTKKYMQATPVPGSDRTYLSALTGEQVIDYPAEFRDQFRDESNIKNGTDEIATIFIQIRSNENPGEAFTKGAIAGGSFVLGGSYALGITGTLLKHPIIGGLTTIVAAAGTGGLKAYGAARDQEIAAGFCGEYTSAEENSYGCSLVMQVDYNNNTLLDQLCAGGIEGQR